MGLTEVSLGLVPGWGGTFLLPNLIGVDAALDVVLWNPLRQNRTLTPPQALDVGLVDAVIPGRPLPGGFTAVGGRGPGR